MEQRTSSSASLRRRKEKKLLQYSAQALSQFILVSTAVFLSLALVGLSVQAYRFVAKGNPSFSIANWLFQPKKASDVPGEESLSSLALQATFTALSLWGRFILSVLIPATDHSIVYAKEGWVALEPSLRQSAIWFLFESSTTFKLGVLSFFVLSFLIWLLEKELKRRRITERISKRVEAFQKRCTEFGDAFKYRYAAVRDEVARNSKIAASLFPHFLYVVACLLLFFFMGDVLHLVSRGFSGWTIMIGIPAALSTQKMIKYYEVSRERAKRLGPVDPSANYSSSEEDEEEDSSSEEEATPSSGKKQLVENALLSVRKRFLSDATLEGPKDLDTWGGLTMDTVHDYDPILDWLRYWTILSVCLLWEQFPVTGHFLAIVPLWPEIRLAFSLWLQLPFTRGCDWGFKVIVPWIDRYVKKVPLLANSSGLQEQQRGFVITLLSSLGIVSKKTGKKLLKATEANGNLILISIPFMISPSFVTKIGVLVVGLSFPAHSSATSVLEIEHFKQMHDKKQDATSTTTEEAGASGEASVFWLEYWVVYVLFSLAHGSMATVFGWWFPLWDQMHLAILLWMQITYFSGARHIFNIAVVMHNVCRRRRRAWNRRIQASRSKRRANSVATPQEKIEDLITTMNFLKKSETIVEEVEGDMEEEEEEEERISTPNATRRSTAELNVLVPDDPDVPFETHNENEPNTPPPSRRTTEAKMQERRSSLLSDTPFDNTFVVVDNHQEE